MIKNADYYLQLPYSLVIQPYRDDEASYFIGKVQELEGCISDGETHEEVLANLREAMEGWIETKLANNLPIPEPAVEPAASGKFTLRLPKTLHQKLTQEAKKEGVSLNQYALYKLAQ